jgi:DNA ligase-1
MKLETIYKRTSTGKIQEWTVEIEGDKFRTISGQVDGKKVTSEWTVAKGKNTGKANATTGAEQALKEATAKRRLKLEGEYKESPDDVDTLDFKEPLLAKDYKEYRNEIEFPYWSQPKLDGVRCIVRADGMYSRNGKPIVAALHIIDTLKKILKAYPHLEFDGELYNHGLKNNFDKIISLVRKSKPTAEDLAESKEVVQYWIYDIRNPDQPFSDRHKLIEALFNEYPAIRAYCVPVETTLCNNQDELDDLYAYYLVECFEVQMVRLDGDGYEFKRSKNLLKRKEFIDEEYTILDIEEGTGNRSGMAGFMRFERNGKPFKSNMRGGVEQYTEWLNNKELYIGKPATVRYQNLTPDGIPRFPVVIVVRDYE